MPGAKPKAAALPLKSMPGASPPTATTPLARKEGASKTGGYKCALIMALSMLGLCFAVVAWRTQLAAQVASLASSMSQRAVPELVVTEACQSCASVCILAIVVVSRFPRSAGTDPSAKDASLDGCLEAGEARAEKQRSSMSSKVMRLMKALGDSEERQKLLEEEEDSGAHHTKATYGSGDQALRDASREPPHVRDMGDGELRIAGVYEHQLLKCGLRLLDEAWAEEGMPELPPQRLFRRSLLAELLAGTRSLQSVTANDVTAAQCDLRQLSARQLLRLRVAHLEFTPSGSGSDVVGTLGGAHEVFMHSNDSLLFEKLGQQAASTLSLQPEPNFHSLGRQMVFYYAAARAVQSPEWWVLWLGERRVFVHGSKLQLADTFPAEGGVLEADDMSKADTLEPTGRLRWFEWRIRHVTEESLLSAPPPKPAEVEESPPSPAAVLSKLNLSPKLLSDALSGLKKVETPLLDVV